tara:strand:+ start:416 stop:5824 length:5409 start_codon:yes stop_codon:yes gene_type:complete
MTTNLNTNDLSNASVDDLIELDKALSPKSSTQEVTPINLRDTNDLSNASVDDLIALDKALSPKSSTQEVTQPTTVSTNPNVPDQEFDMDDLDSKKDWLQQARTIYNYENKNKKFKGSNKQLSDWFKDRHSSLANNLTNLGKTAYDTSNMSDDVKKAWAQSLDTYDKTNSDFGTFLRAVANTFADPLTYAGLAGTAGLGVVAKVAGKGLAKKGLKELLGRFDFKKQLNDAIASQTTKKTAEEFAKTGTAKGVTKEVLKKARKEAAINIGKNQTVTGFGAGAGWGGGFSGAREALEVGIDKKDEVDLLNIAIGTLGGGVLGGVAGRYLPRGTEKIGRSRALGKVTEEDALIPKQKKVINEENIVKPFNDSQFENNVRERALYNQQELELNGTININIPKGNLTNDNIKVLKEIYGQEGIDIRQVGNSKNQFTGTKHTEKTIRPVTLSEGRIKTQKILASFKGNFYDDSGLGQSFKDAQTRRGNINRTIERNIEKTSRSLEKAILKNYKIKSFKDLGNDELPLINNAMNGDADAIETLSSRGFTDVVKQTQQMRKNIDDLQEDLLNSGVIDKTSTAGKELVTKINKSRDGTDSTLYVTRQYESFDNPNWKTDLPKKDGGQKIINDATELIHSQRIQGYQNWLRKQNKENKIQYDKDMAEWVNGGQVGTPPNKPRIIKLTNAKTAELWEKSVKDIDEILTQKNSGDLLNVLNKKDKQSIIKQAKILTRRQDIPKQIRLLLGEYDDPFTNYANTVKNLFTTIETFKYEEEIARLIDIGELQGAAKYADAVPEMDTPLTTKLPTKSGDQTTLENRLKQLKEEKEQFNMSQDEYEIRDKLIREEFDKPGINKPLKGYRAYPEVAQAIQMNNELQPVASAAWQNWFLTPQAYTRAAKTVYSPSAIARNFLGSSMMALGAGYMRPSKVRGMIDISKALTQKENIISGDVPNEEIEKMMVRGLALGTTQSGTDFNALKGALAEAGNKDYFNFQSPVYKGTNELKKRAKKYNTSAVKLYQAMDDVWKEFAFLNERDMQRQTLLDKGIDPNEIVRTLRTDKGTPVPITRLDVEAAKLVGDHMQNYANVPRIIKMSRRLPFADFLAFKTEMARTSKNIIKNAYNDIKDGNELMSKGEKAFDIDGKETGLLKGQHQRSEGMKRMGAIVSTISFVPALAATSAYIMGMEEPVEDTGYTKAEGIERIMSTDYNKGSNYLNFGTDQNGKGRRINLSYINPWAAGSDMITAAVRAASEGRNIDSAMSKAATEGIIAPLRDTFSISMLGSLVKNIYENKNEYGEKLFDNKDNSLDYLKTTVAEIYKAFEPGGIKSARDIFTAADLSKPEGVKRPKDLVGMEGFDAEPSLIDRYGIKKGKTGTKKYLQDQITGLAGIKPEAYDLNTIFPLKLKSIERKNRDTINSFKDVYQNRGITTVQELVDGYRKSLEDSYSYAKDAHDLVQQYKAAASKENAKGKIVAPNSGDINRVITRSGLFKERMDKNLFIRISSGKYFPKKPNLKDIIKWAKDTKKETGFRPPVNEAFGLIMQLYGQYQGESLNPQERKNGGLVKMAEGGSIMDSLLDMLNPISKANVGEEEALKIYLGQSQSPKPVEFEPVLPNVIPEVEDRSRTAPLPPKKPPTLIDSKTIMFNHVIERLKPDDQEKAYRNLEKFAELTRNAESSNNYKAVNIPVNADDITSQMGWGKEATTAKGAYQFVDGSIVPALNRLKRLIGEQPWMTDLRKSNDIFSLTNRQQDLLFFGDMFEKTVDGTKGLGDKLLKKIMKGDKNAMFQMYKKAHHTGELPPEALKNARRNFLEGNK